MKTPRSIRTLHVDFGTHRWFNNAPATYLFTGEVSDLKNDLLLIRPMPEFESGSHRSRSLKSLL
jgi:hypothetical protein